MVVPGDEPQRQAVAGLDVRVPAREQDRAHREAVGAEDVALLAVRVVEESDARRAVGIVLDRGDRPGDTDLVALEVDDPVALLVTTAAEAAGDAAVVVAAAVLVLRLDERALRLGPGDLLEITDRVIPARRRGRLE